MTFDGMAKLCAEAAGVAEPEIVHYDPKSVEVPEGAAAFRAVHAKPCTVEATKLEHDPPPTPNPKKKENQHKSSYIYVPTFWSLQSTIKPHSPKLNPKRAL